MSEPQVPVPEKSAAASSLRRATPARLSSYGIALGAVATAFLLRWAIYGSLDTRLPFAFFLPAVMFAGWYGGLGPGLLAAGTGLVLGDYFFLPPHVAWGPLGEPQRTAITFYAMTSTVSVVLLDNLHVRIRALETELRRLDGRPEHTSGPD